MKMPAADIGDWRAGRYAIYFRLWFNAIDDYRLELLTDIWRGWRI
jgi:hypothetical protein